MIVNNVLHCKANPLIYNILSEQIDFINFKSQMANQKQITTLNDQNRETK